LGLGAFSEIAYPMSALGVAPCVRPAASYRDDVIKRREFWVRPFNPSVCRPPAQLTLPSISLKNFSGIKNFSFSRRYNISATHETSAVLCPPSGCTQIFSSLQAHTLSVALVATYFIGSKGGEYSPAHDTRPERFDALVLAPKTKARAKLGLVFS
jgi:hypothetical protein